MTRGVEMRDSVKGHKKCGGVWLVSSLLCLLEDMSCIEQSMSARVGDKNTLKNLLLLFS